MLNHITLLEVVVSIPLIVLGTRRNDDYIFIHLFYIKNYSSIPIALYCIAYPYSYSRMGERRIICTVDFF